VNAVSNCVVPKITVIVGGSFGAGNYALCGKAFDPRFVFAWPNARYAVMGAEQASDTLFAIMQRAHPFESRHTSGTGESPEEQRRRVKEDYEKQADIRYGAARGWIDAIIAPDRTRAVLIRALEWVKREPPAHKFHTGVLQV
jgi:acetyl-CoA carboxylase carboxyltransferase component